MELAFLAWQATFACGAIALLTYCLVQRPLWVFLVGLSAGAAAGFAIGAVCAGVKLSSAPSVAPTGYEWLASVFWGVIGAFIGGHLGAGIASRFGSRQARRWFAALAGLQVAAAALLVGAPHYLGFSAAVHRGNLRLARVWLWAGRDPDARVALCPERSTALVCAVRHGRQDMALLLLQEGADPSGRYDLGRTPLHYAAREGHVRMAELLIERGADVNAGPLDTPLHEASCEGRTEVVRLLLRHGAEPGRRDRHRFGPLHLAARGGHAETAELLLDRGAEVNAKGDGGSTPLHLALLNGHTEVARLLLQRGADVNAKAADGKGALRIAEERGDTKMVELLREHGATE